MTSLPQRVLWERGYKVYSNAYAGNESPKTVGAVDAGQLYRAIATVTGGLYEGATVDTRASEDCTIDEPDFLAGYQGEAEV